MCFPPRAIQNVKNKKQIELKHGGAPIWFNDTVISDQVHYNLVNRIRQMRAQHVFQNGQQREEPNNINYYRGSQRAASFLGGKVSSFSASAYTCFFFFFQIYWTSPAGGERQVSIISGNKCPIAFTSIPDSSIVHYIFSIPDGYIQNSRHLIWLYFKMYGVFMTGCIKLYDKPIESWI